MPKPRPDRDSTISIKNHINDKNVILALVRSKKNTKTNFGKLTTVKLNIHQDIPLPVAREKNVTKNYCNG